ncbi:MAG: tetratricopeptide repeat protein [Persicimonas sp.]
MPKRLISALIVCFAVQLAVGGQAFAEEMTFGEEEVEDEPADSGPYPEYLAEGKKLYESGKYEEASLMFYKVASATDVAAEAHVPEAEYELGKTLLRMELYQGALSFFGNIVDLGEDHPYFLPTLRGLVLLTDVIPGDPTLLERLAPYAHYFPEDVPEKYRDQFAYLVGRHFYREMQSDEALRLLTAVSKRSEYFGKAHYIAGITHVADYQAGPAVEQFKQVLSHLRSKDETGELSSDEQRLLEMTTLAMARVFYSTGDYETSLKYYSSVDRNSNRWADALFESSWAFFQTDDYNKALGNLHSLNSPFFADAYFPEGPILSAVIFFYNCKYERVRHVLDDFSYYYEPLQEDVEALLKDYPGSMEMYTWLKEREEGEVEFDPQVYQIVNAALDDAQVERKFALVETIEQEKEKIGGMPDSWRSSELGSTLMQESELGLSFAVDDAGGLARERLSRVVDELNDLIVQQKEILFEVARAERGEVQADIRAGMQVEGDVTDEPSLNISDEQMYWTFQGEYWRDELGAYVYNINSQCSR